MTDSSGADGSGSGSTANPSEVPEVIPAGTTDLASANGAGAGARDDGTTPADEGNETDVLSPAKVIRIGAMLKQLLEEVRNTSIDEAARGQLGTIYKSSIAQLKSALSPDLGEELDELSFDFNDGEPPSESELRMAQAQLVGWLEGLFHGIQAMMVAQQMAARQQLEGARFQAAERSGSAAPGPGYI